MNCGIKILRIIVVNTNIIVIKKDLLCFCLLKLDLEAPVDIYGMPIVFWVMLTYAITFTTRLALLFCFSDEQSKN